MLNEIIDLLNFTHRELLKRDQLNTLTQSKYVYNANIDVDFGTFILCFLIYMII